MAYSIDEQNKCSLKTLKGDSTYEISVWKG